jgi:hypothetical protein
MAPQDYYILLLALCVSRKFYLDFKKLRELRG